MRKEHIRIAGLIFVILVFNVLLLHPMREVRWWKSHEGQSAISRLMAFTDALEENGTPRWNGWMCAHRGSPMFTFYAPGIFYISSVFIKLGFNEYCSIHIMIFIVRLAGGTAIFLTLIFLGLNRASALLGSLLFSVFPYQSTCLFTRGAFAELAAMNTVPLIALFTVITLKRHGYWAIGLAPAVWAVIYLHNITAMLTAIFCACLVLILIPLAFRTKEMAKRLLALFIGAILGVGLASPFWLTAISLKHHVNIESMFNSNLVPSHLYFLEIGDLFRLVPPHLKHTNHFEMDFHFPLILCFFLLISIFEYLKSCIKGDYRNRHNIDSDVLSSPLWYGGALFMSLLTLLVSLKSTSFLFYKIPGLHYAQFPYRVFSILATMTTLGAAYGIYHVIKKIKYSDFFILPLVAFIVILLDFGLLQSRFVKDKNLDLESLRAEFDKSYVETVHINEYSPACIDPLKAHKTPIPPKGAEVTTNSNHDVTISVFTMRSGLITFNATSSQKVTLNIAHYWFPGWKAYSGNKELSLTQNKENGEMQLVFPGGTNVPISIEFRDSTPVKKGKTIATMSLLLLTLWLSLIIYNIFQKEK